MNKAKQMHGGKKHGGQHCIQHIGKKPCANHAGMQHGDKKPCPKMQAAKHGKMKHCDKKPGMKHGCKKHMSHGHKGIVEKPCNADCPRGCQHGPSDNCPNRNDEQLEELFTEEAK